MLLNAMVVGFALATWLCGLLAIHAQRDRGGAGWHRATSDFAEPARRFAFLNAVLGLLVAGLMSIWPRLRSIAIPDESIGRVTAGFGAHLFLLLVLLWAARRLKLMTFHMLSIVAVVSSAGFMMMRAYPYTPHFQ